MDTSVIDPPIPYAGFIPGGIFNPGKMVKIQGLAPSIGYRFNIHLQCGRGIIPRDDVAVQISVRFLDGYISINSLKDGIWGEEQLGSLPLKRNEKFEIIIMCDLNQYKVAINNQHYCEFPQRIHYDRITHVAIDGDVSIFRISYESVAGSDTGVASGNASSPIPTPPADNEGDDFEMIDATTNRPRQSGRRPPPPPVGFSQPPSYEAAVDASTRPPYPTSGPVGMPYPTSGPVGMPYPSQGSRPPYPTHGTAMPHPTNMPTTSNQYPPAGVQSLPPPFIGAPTPLNANTPYFRPAKPNNARKCAITCCAVVVSIIIIIAVIAAKISVSRQRTKSHADDTYYHSNNYDDYKNTYGNSYDQYNSNNNYGSHNSYNNHWQQ